MMDMNMIPGMMAQPQPVQQPVSGQGGAGATVGATMPGRVRQPTLPTGQAMEVRAPDNATPAKPSNPTGRPPGWVQGGMMMRRATTG